MRNVASPNTGLRLVLDLMQRKHAYVPHQICVEEYLTTLIEHVGGCGMGGGAGRESGGGAM